MRVAHHLMMPAPPRPELDAVVRDAMLLIESFGGELDFLYPAARHHRLIPRRLYGATQLAQLRAIDRRVDAHQVTSNGLFAYPALGVLTKPVIYSLTTPLGRRWLPGAPIRRAALFVTPIERDAARLHRLGAARVEVVVPGIELARFTGCPPPSAEGFVVLAGSAPWTSRQFRTKGVELLLDAAVRRPELRLVLLWRGTTSERLRSEVDRRGLTGRVEIVERTVNVAEVLAGTHAAVVLAASPKLVKAYPHSLLEALAAGRPVLVSSALELATRVERSGAGELVAELTLPALLTALDRLIAGYEERRRAVATMDLSEFSRRRFVERFGEIYRQLGGERR